MQQVQLTCEVVTPLFCAGADQQRPEVRAPSLRGAMRFWFRALMGSIVGDRIDTLRALEANVFGTTERASSVRVLVRPSAKLPVGEFDFKQHGLRYLGYGLSGTREKTPRAYIAPGARFSIDLASEDEMKLNLAAASLWLFLNVGSLGARCRRGWGSLHTVAESGPSSFRFALPLGSALRPTLQRTLRLIRQTVVSSVPSSGMQKTETFPTYPCLSSPYWRLKLVATNERRRPFPTWEEAMVWAYQQLRGFREDPHSRPRDRGNFQYKVGRDYGEVKKVFVSTSQERVGPLHLPIFGLPVQYRFQSEGGRLASIQGEHHDRRGSPLWLKVYKGDVGFILGFMLFKAQFLPEDENLVIKGPGKTLRASQPDYTLLDEFFDHLPGEEVTL